MRREVEKQVEELDESTHITVMGNVSREEVFRRMREASFLVCPSHWFEGCPLVVVEAFACGLPVIATGHGPTAEMIEHERTGLHIAPGEDGRPVRTALPLAQLASGAPALGQVNVAPDSDGVVRRASSRTADGGRCWAQMIARKCANGTCPHAQTGCEPTTMPRGHDRRQW